MKYSNLYEWLGFIIFIVSFFLYGVVRYNGSSNTFLLFILVSLIIIGALITFISFFIRKFKSR
jgi:hypothetical protein